MGASLVVLAAGMGSRYGGLKQIDEFGPNGESLLEYAVYDALQAGFDHIVFIIREEFKDAFVEKFASMLERCPRYDLVFQEVNPQFPDITTVMRERPWGTLHAVLCARDVVDQPFAVINADDWYGTKSYALLLERLKTVTEGESFLVGYVLDKTLSNHGTVNRGVCKVDAHNHLVTIQERYKIGQEDSIITDGDGDHLTGNETVAMTFMGFHQTFLSEMFPILLEFIKNNCTDSRGELPITNAMDPLIRNGTLSCEVIYSPDSWQGVTNPEDKPKVQQAFDEMIQQGIYPNNLR